MIFIIEKLLSDLNSKEKEWEHRRDEWVKGGDYRNPRQYREERPSPKDKIRAWVKVIFVAITVIHLLVLLGLYIHEKATAPDPPKEQVKSVSYKNGDECSKYKVGDIGQIKYGDYEGAEVKIIGGCKSGEAYEVITTKDQTLFGPGSANESYTDKNIKEGLTFKVNNSDNLIITGHEKEVKE